MVMMMYKTNADLGEWANLLAKMFNQVLIFVVFLGVGVLGEFDKSLLSEEKRELMVTLHKTCADQIGISEDDIQKLRNGEFEDNKNPKCYMKCLMTESGVMDENGGIDSDAFGELLPDQLKSKVKKTFEECVHSTGQVSDHCDKAIKITQCLHDKDPENFFVA